MSNSPPPPSVAHRDRYYFIHVMKTGGATLTYQMHRQFPPGRIYGFGAQGAEFITRTYLYVNPRPLAHLSSERVNGVPLFGGHFPYAARSLMGDGVSTVTVLRDPVDRVISLLKHCQRSHPEHQDLSLEEIYEDDWYFPRFFDNHEVRMFSMTADEMLAHSERDGWAEQGWAPDELALLARWREQPELLSDAERVEFHELVVGELDTARGVYRMLGAPNTADVEVDPVRVVQALENLSQVDVIGFVDAYDEFMRELSARMGLDLDSTVRHNVGDDAPVSRELRRRVESNLAPSLELYEHAQTLQRERRL